MNPMLHRRQALCCGAALLGGLFTSLIDAAPADGSPADPPRRLDMPTASRAILDAALDGIDAAQLWDVHAHLLGTGDGGSGCWVNPALDSWWHPLEVLRKRVILHGAGVRPDSACIDHDYVRRLHALASGFPAGARWMLFAFDHAHDDQGAEDRAHSTFHVPNRWAAQVAQHHADRFGWVASVHPYRDDAVVALQQAIDRGALALKWLPSAMNIDLRSARCRPVYHLLARTRLPLVVHCGEEKAVPGAGRDAFGNPLLVREPLRHGVRVIVAHCASLGEALDLDARAPGEVPAFELFARLMDEREWQGRLFGDVSAVFQVNRRRAVWRTIIGRTDWHERLLHGSDYPLPCVAPLVQLGPLVRAGVLAAADVEPLEGLRAANPLLFDLVLKRRVRWRGAHLADAVFQTRRRIERA